MTLGLLRDDDAWGWGMESGGGDEVAGLPLDRVSRPLLGPAPGLWLSFITLLTRQSGSWCGMRDAPLGDLWANGCET